MNRIGFIGGSDMRRIMEGDWISLWEEKTGRKKPDDLSDVLPVTAWLIHRTVQYQLVSAADR